MHKTSIFYTRIFTVLSFLLFPIIYFLILLRKRKTGDDVKVLVIPQLTRVGDIVCSTPVFQAIKEKYPKSRVVVLVSLKASGIIKNNPRIDEIINIEDYKGNFFGLMKKILDERFDFGVSLSGTAFSSTLFFYGFIPNRIKITRPDGPWSEVFTDWMSNFKYEYKNLSYLPAFYLKLLEPLNIYKKEVKKEVFWSKVSDNNIDLFFQQNNITSQDKIVGVSLTAGNKIKEWGDEKFTVLVREIVARFGMKIIFIGGPGDKDRVQKVIDSLVDKNNYINSVGISLEDLPALMNRFNFFISVDTGPTHIAESLGVPLIDILGPVNDIELTPRGKHSRIIKADGVEPTVFAFQPSGEPNLIKKSLDDISASKVLSIFDNLYNEVVKN
ncbi:MAG: glycosyltransferase family 9 protein [Parcubacteria group bacterium]